MIVTFTGPHKPKAPKSIIQARIEDALTMFPHATGFISGAAPYVDSMAYRTAAYNFPSAIHTIYVPCDRSGEPLWHNEDVVRDARDAGHEVEYIYGGYLKRDDAMVRAADVLLAFPNSMREELRSGTWATIRRAWKRDVPVYYFPLDGQPGPVLRCM